MKVSTLVRLLTVASAAFFFANAALAQNPGTVTNHAFVIGKGAGQTGYTSLLCGSAQLAVGQTTADPICRTLTGDVTLSAAGVTAIGATKVTSAMLNADVYSTAHTWAGQQTFVAPILGTPASGTLTNATGLPISTGVSGLGTGIANFLATPSSANLRSALTDEVGTGAAYFVGGALGTPASGTLTNATGLPVSGLAAQAAWSFVVNNTGSSAVPTAVDIASLTTKGGPGAADYVILSDQAAAGALKKATVSSIASAGSVASIAGNTGSFTLSNGITNSVNDIRGVNATASAVGVVKRQRIAHVRDEQTASTAGGTFTSGADRIRTINTEVSDLDGIVSIASNQFTLQAGTWLIEWSAPGYKIDQHQSLLYNATDSTVVTRGTSEYTTSVTATVATRSTGRAIVTIAGAKAFEIRHRGTTTQASNGFGEPGNFGTEVYTEVRIMSYDQ